jgi:hypothetical protein
LPSVASTHVLASLRGETHAHHRDRTPRRPDPADQPARAAFIAAATDIVADLAGPEHRREDTWVNILNAPDGAWGLGGKAYTGEALIAAITGAAG